MKILKLDQGNDEWLEWRDTGLGASDTPVIFEVSPWKTRLQLWEEKLGIRENDNDNTYIFSKGHEFEEIAREMYEEKTGKFVEPACIESEEYPWLLSSLDGITMEQDRIAEIKYLGKEDYDNAKNGVVPEKYIPQVQHQLLATDGKVDICDFIVYNEDEDDIAIVEVEADKEIQDKIIEKGKKFWDMIQDRKAPKATDRDIVEKKDKKTKKAVKEYSKAKEEYDRAKEAVKQAKKRLYELAGDNSIKCNGVKVRRYYRKGRVDYKSIPELEEVNLSEYRKGGSVNYRITEEKK